MEFRGTTDEKQPETSPSPRNVKADGPPSEDTTASGPHIFEL